MESNNKAWLSTDYSHDGVVIIGNQLGLEELRNCLNEALINSETEKTILIQDSDISAISLQSEDHYYKEIEYFDDAPKEGWGDKLLTFILSVIAFIWFMILPAVGVHFLISSAIDSEKTQVKIEQFQRL
jgi:hypothetical protein